MVGPVRHQPLSESLDLNRPAGSGSLLVIPQSAWILGKGIKDAEQFLTLPPCRSRKKLDYRSINDVVVMQIHLVARRRLLSVNPLEVALTDSLPGSEISELSVQTGLILRIVRPSEMRDQCSQFQALFGAQTSYLFFYLKKAHAGILIGLDPDCQLLMADDSLGKRTLDCLFSRNLTV